MPPRGAARAPPSRACRRPLAPLCCAGLAGEISPLQIEKKIRAVQKKLRRVQMIEQTAGSDNAALDSGQQVLLASKPRLQASTSNASREAGTSASQAPASAYEWYALVAGR